MPRYGYRCEECKNGWDEFKSMEENNDTNCPKCGKKAVRDYSKSTTRFFPFKPMWYTDICEKPLWIESKKQLKEECDKHGVIACRLL